MNLLQYIQEAKERYDDQFGKLCLGILSGDEKSPVFINQELQVPRLKNFIESELTLLAQKVEEETRTEIRDLIHERKVEHHKKCLEDMFINGRFWEAQDLWEIIGSLPHNN